MTGKELLYDPRPGCGMDPDRPGVWIGDYEFACHYVHHLHVFHGEHMAADVIRADRRCRDGALDQIALIERPKQHWTSSPQPSRADHHHRNGQPVTPT